VLGSEIAALDATVVNIALSAIGREFHADVAAPQWVMTGYALPLAPVVLRPADLSLVVLNPLAAGGCLAVGRWAGRRGGSPSSCETDAGEGQEGHRDY